MVSGRHGGHRRAAVAIVSGTVGDPELVLCDPERDPSGQRWFTVVLADSLVLPGRRRRRSASAVSWTASAAWSGVGRRARASRRSLMVTGGCQHRSCGTDDCAGLGGEGRDFVSRDAEAMATRGVWGRCERGVGVGVRGAFAANGRVANQAS